MIFTNWNLILEKTFDSPFHPSLLEHFFICVFEGEINCLARNAKKLHNLGFLFKELVIFQKNLQLKILEVGEQKPVPRETQKNFCPLSKLYSMIWDESP